MKPELDKAIAAANAHTRLERDEEYGGMICAECGFSLGALPIESDARFRHGMEAAALVLLAPYQERIKELEGQAEKARRLLVELEQSVDAGAGLIPTTVLEPRLNEIFAALSEYRDDPKVGEIRGFIVNVDCPIHGAPAVASVSDVKTNVEEDASHE